ncbi:lipase 3 [Solenopsis invicta]|uniref:lipase 3 n=1 Tax=Solenopsis invicta TaxID=13686 RepID=UPI0001FE7F29|nr:lipase 3 [Solenopsis invicta]
MLPILLLSLLASASALPYLSIDQLPEYTSNKIEKIPYIKEFDDPEFWRSVQSEYGSVTTLDLVHREGYNGELHKVTTIDGYILEMHRITGRANSGNSQAEKPAVLLMHGLLCSSACWVVTGPEKSLGYILADAGYDVWLGNTRGNTYTREHSFPDIEDEVFWNFSFHESGMYDLPAMIDYIVKATGQEKIIYMGHSQGTTTFFVMASERPEYQDKIKVMFAMAPVAYCGRMDNPIFQFLSRFSGPLEKLMKLIGMNEFKPTGEIMRHFAELVCDKDAITQPLCSNIMFLIAGFNEEQLNKTLIPIIVEHAPAGASTKQIMHYAQLIKSGFLSITSGKFRQYDYGLAGNLKKYGSIHPPNYNLGKIKLPVVLHYATNDWLAHVNDVNKLEKELGNVYGKFRVPHDKFNHIDFMWATDVKELLYDKMLSLMTRF